jgi:hypothetical protein
MALRALRRDRAARTGPELFLYERAFADCLERIELHQKRFETALLIGCPNPTWRTRLGSVAGTIDVLDPGPLFAERAQGKLVTEDTWQAPDRAYDLVLAVGTLDTVNQLPLALRLIRHSIGDDGMFLAALSGGETLPQLRAAMRAADAQTGAAAPHVHPRIEAAALAPLLADAGFTGAVVDIDRVTVSYTSLEHLIRDLRAMGATNILKERPRFVGRASRDTAARAFADAGDGTRTIETYEILHFATWTADKG